MPEVKTDEVVSEVKFCAMPHNNSAYEVCRNFRDSDQGWCLNCGHEKACHDNP
jgi:hypothetical protein